MNRARATRAAIAAAALFASGFLAACESTQEKAAALQEQGEALVADQVGVTVDKENPDVKVVSTHVMSDQNGGAVAIELQNTSSKALAMMPIQIDVLDAKGKSVFTNTIPGLDDSLTHVPLLRPNETTYWVNDQVLATGTPKTVKVKVGEPTEPSPASIPELAVSEPRIHNDPSGIEVEGQVENKSQVDQQKLVLFAVAKRGDDVIAAGRGQFKNLAAGGKPLRFNIFFIGNPTGADVQVFAPPSALE